MRPALRSTFPAAKGEKWLISLTLTFLRHRRFFPPSSFFKCYRNQPVELLIIEMPDRRVEWADSQQRKFGRFDLKNDEIGLLTGIAKSCNVSHMTICRL